jgi:chromosome partitioning protein
MSKTKVITLSIHKGGTGKSTICVNLSYALSKMGYRVLLIDTDDQKNLSRTMGFEENNSFYGNKNFYSCMVNALMDAGGSKDLKDYIMPTGYENIDIVISHEHMNRLEKNMPETKEYYWVVRNVLNGVIDMGIYDFIVIDTDKTQGKMNSSILCASDYIMIPLIPSQYGVEGVGGSIRQINELQTVNPNMEILGVVLNIVDRREKVASETDIAVRKALGDDHVFDTWVLKDVNIDNSQAERLPVAVAYPKTKVVESYSSLAREVIKRVQER